MVAARVRQNHNQTVTGLSTTPDLAPSMRGYFEKEVPFGHARTAAYLVFGLCVVADLMERQRWPEAEALIVLLLASAEQAALQEWNWGLAWLLTFSSEPPWTRIRGHPPGSAGAWVAWPTRSCWPRPWVTSRLASLTAS